MFEDLFGEFSDSEEQGTVDTSTPADPHPVSDSEMEVAQNDDEANWEDVLPAADEGPPVTPKPLEGVFFVGNRIFVS